MDEGSRSSYRPATGSVLADGVVYVNLHTLDDATLTSVMPKLSDAKAIIFDLRGYIGTAAFVPLEYLTDRELRSVLNHDGSLFRGRATEAIELWRRPRTPLSFEPCIDR
jgi:hypothetical protein